MATKKKIELEAVKKALKEADGTHATRVVYRNGVANMFEVGKIYDFPEFDEKNNVLKFRLWVGRTALRGESYQMSEYITKKGKGKDFGKVLEKGMLVAVKSQRYTLNTGEIDEYGRAILENINVAERIDILVAEDDNLLKTTKELSIIEKMFFK